MMFRHACVCVQPIPQAAHDTGGFLEREDHDVHGEFDLIRYAMRGFVIEPGAGSKDTNMTLDLILMDIVMSKRSGEHVKVLVSDCGPHQHNQFMVSLQQWLVDHGWFSVPPPL